MTRKLIAVALLAGFTQSAYTADDSVPTDRSVTRVDTYGHSAVLHITPPFANTQGCLSYDGDKVVIDFISDSHKKMYAQVIAAAMAGNAVGFGLSGCSANLPEYPAVFRVDSQFIASESNSPADAPIDTAVQSYTEINIQAEDGVLGGHAVATDQPGYEGSGFVDVIGEGELSYSFTANNGSYDLDIRYAMGDGGTRPLQLEVNGSVVATLDFGATGNWETWKNESLTVTLMEGQNTIKLITTGKSGANIDQLRFVLNP